MDYLFNRIIKKIEYRKQKRLDIILQEINDGKRKNLNDITFSCEELLNKDDYGITFLEKILNKGFDVNWETQGKIKNNIEIAYIYFKCNREKYFFELKEEDLFLVVDDKTYLEYFLEKNFYLDMIDKIENHIEIIDVLINTDNTYFLKKLNSKIINLLIERNSNGEYLIEKYFKNKDIVKKLIVLVDAPIIFLELHKKYSNFGLLEDASEGILMTKMDDGRYFIEYLINDRKIIPNKLKNLSSNIDFLNFAVKNDLWEYIDTIPNDTLLIDFNSKRTFLDYLIDEVDEIKFRDKITCIYGKKIISILIKKKRLDLANDVSAFLLLDSIKEFGIRGGEKNYTLLEYMLDNGYVPIRRVFLIYCEDILRILYKKKRIDLLLKISPNLILKKIGDSTNITYLEYILECIESEEISIEDLGNLYFYVSDSKEYYISIGRYDVVEKIVRLENARTRSIYKDNPRVLLDNPLLLLNKIDESSDVTYLDYILKYIFNKKMKINLNKIARFYTNINDKAEYYIIVARNDMIDYLKELDVDMLLEKENGVTLLEILLEIDRELTLNNILTYSVKTNFKIAGILWDKGIEINDVNIIDNSNNFSRDYLEGYNNHLGIGPLKEEGDLLLEKLKKLFMEDGKSDKELIDVLISSYRNYLFMDYELGIKELNKIIMLKERNRDKLLYNIGRESCFFSHGGNILCEALNVEDVAHETGHALHWFLSNYQIPNEYDEIVSKLRNNKELLDLTEEFTKKYDELVEKIKIKLKSNCEDFFKIYYNDDKRRDIREFLKKEKQGKIEELLKLGVSYEKIVSFLEIFYTEDNYIINQKNQISKEKYEVVMGCEFRSTRAILDILDAIYEGALMDGKLKNEEGKVVKSPVGHGLAYYYMTNQGFIEMIAQFINIMKSEDSYEMLDVLKSIVGEELYNMLSEFYYRNILGIEETIRIR